LPATVRSRCQRLEFRVPPADEARTWLRAQVVADAQACDALLAARGNPGLAAHWTRSGGLRLRGEVLKSLESLREGRGSPIELALSWLADEHSELRLRFAAELALEAATRGQGMHGARSAAAGLTPPADFPKLSAWFDGVNRLREQLGAPLRHDLVLAGLLLDWRRLYDADGVRA
jgi:DNA polymerase-3 subunit delta'